MDRRQQKQPPPPSSFESHHHHDTAFYLQSAARSVLDDCSPAKSQDSDDDDDHHDTNGKQHASQPLPSLSSLQQEKRPALPDEQDRKIFVGCLAAVLASSYDYDVADDNDDEGGGEDSFLTAESLAYLEQSVVGGDDTPLAARSSTHMACSSASPGGLQQASSFTFDSSEHHQSTETAAANSNNTGPAASFRKKFSKDNNRQGMDKARRRHQKRRYDVLSRLLLQAADHLQLEKSQAKAFLPMLSQVLVPKQQHRQYKQQYKQQRETKPSVSVEAAATVADARGVKPLVSAAAAAAAAAAKELTVQEAIAEIEHLQAFLETLSPGAGLRCLALFLLQHLLHSKVGYDARVRRAIKTVGVLVLLHDGQDEEEAQGASQSRLAWATRKFESLEHTIAQKLIQLSKAQDNHKLPRKDSSTSNNNHDLALNAAQKSQNRQRLIRSLKIGGTAVAAGALFAVTGGLAAPGIAAGLAAVAGGTAATAAVALLSSTAAVTTIFGVGGGSLAAYKMNRRTKGLTEFEFHKESNKLKDDNHDNEDDDGTNGGQPESEIEAELFSTVCISGWLRDDCDFQRPWGVTPSEPPLDHLELLERFYSVHRPDHVRKCATILESWKGEEDQLWDLIREKYGRDPNHLFPLDGPRQRGALTLEQREIVDQLFVELGFAAPPKEPAPAGRFGRMKRPWGKSSQASAAASETEEPRTEEMTPPRPYDSLHGPSFDEFTFADVTSVASSGFDSVSTAVGPPAEQQPSEDSKDTDGAGYPKHLATVWDYTSTYGGEMYTVRWESHLLTELCDSVADLALGLVSGGAQTLVKHTALAASLGALLTAVAWPAALVQAANMIDGTWTLAVERADEAGKELARSLLFSRAGNRPLTLVGYSFGARAIYSCLKELAKYQEEWEDYQEKKLQQQQQQPQTFRARRMRSQESLTDDDTFYETMREPASIVEDVVLMGLPNHLSLLSWKACRQVVAGRLVHCFSQKDLILSLMFQVKRFGVKPVCGTCPVDVNGVENVDLTDLVQGHQDYCLRTGDILKRVRHCEPLRSKPALNYTAALAAELNNQVADEVANLELR